MTDLEYEKKAGQYLSAIEDGLARILKPEEPVLQGNVLSAMAYSVLGGGKRIRGSLTLAFMELCGGEWEKALSYACGVEMIHAYSLIHDDLPCMDNDSLRRGKPACHIQFGEANALLAGDALLTLAFETLAKAELPAEANLEAIKILSQAAGAYGMVGGQVIDLESEGRRIDLDTLRELQRLKTGKLIKAAAQLGCVAAGASAIQMEKAVRYAESIGLSFQIIDDILDAVGDELQLGKPVGSDERNHKTTYVTLFGAEKAADLAKEVTEQGVSALSGFTGRDANMAFLQMLAGSLLHRLK